jgi:hypothetical protein
MPESTLSSHASPYGVEQCYGKYYMEVNRWICSAADYSYQERNENILNRKIQPSCTKKIILDQGGRRVSGEGPIGGATGVVSPPPPPPHPS